MGRQGVTIAIPNWNHEVFLPRSIASGLAAVKELRRHGLGGGGPGGRRPIAGRIADASAATRGPALCRWAAGPALAENGGVCRARNEALRRARYRHVLVMDADNEVIPENVILFHRAMNDTGAAVVYGNLIVHEWHQARQRLYGNETFQPKIFEENYIDNFSMLDRDQALSRTSGYCAGFPRSGPGRLGVLPEHRGQRREDRFRSGRDRQLLLHARFDAPGNIRAERRRSSPDPADLRPDRHSAEPAGECLPPAVPSGHRLLLNMRGNMIAPFPRETPRRRRCSVFMSRSSPILSRANGPGRPGRRRSQRVVALVRSISFCCTSGSPSDGAAAGDRPGVRRRLGGHRRCFSWGTRKFVKSKSCRRRSVPPARRIGGRCWRPRSRIARFRRSPAYSVLPVSRVGEIRRCFRENELRPPLLVLLHVDEKESARVVGKNAGGIALAPGGRRRGRLPRGAHRPLRHAGIPDRPLRFAPRASTGRAPRDLSLHRDQPIGAPVPSLEFGMPTRCSSAWDIGSTAISSSFR